MIIVGITLVALVVTIVVLLILAGITIVYVFGDNSVFKQASEAKLRTDIAQWQEKLEMAKSPVFIEELGTLDVDKYFEYIEKQGIIEDKETDVINNNDGTYDVTTKPGYVFLVTLIPNKENPKDAEIEYLGKIGNLQPKIKGINIVEATKTSFKIKVSARLEGGEVLCYYKAKANIAANEVENDITGYEQISLDSNLEGSVTSGLTAGTTYKVKAVLKKDGKGIGWVSKEVTTVVQVQVTSVTLNKTETKIGIGKSEILTATIEPNNAEDKSIEWKAEPSTIATVDQNGKVTGVAVGSVTITATAKDGSRKSASCTVTVEQEESDWAKIAEVAKLIAEDNTITRDRETVTKGGMTITVGETFYVKYDGVIKEVIVLGFNHDTLSTPSGATTTAGISFQFKDFMTDTSYVMNSNSTNNYGWGGEPVGTNASDMRTYLEGSEGIGKLSATLQSKIKRVKKKYLLGNKSSTVRESDDKLWLLSCSEVFSGPTVSNTGGFGYAKAEEGKRYKYYMKLKATDTGAYSELVKRTTSGTVLYWWLRSPYYDNSYSFCCVTNGGGSNYDLSYAGYGMSPGFSI